MKILYLAGFPNEYDDNVFIQARKKSVISCFEESNYKIDFLYNSYAEHPLILANAKMYYSRLLPCSVGRSFIEKIHCKLFEYSGLYSTFILRLLEKKFNLKINSYDVIIAESWHHLAAVLPFAKGRKIIGRIYGTSNLTERIEKNSIWKLHPFFNRIKRVINSDKIIGIIFNSTGSRSRTLFELLSDNTEKLSPVPVYLDMPNSLFSTEKPKERLKDGTLQLLQVGRMTDRHGFDLTIKIVERLVKQHDIPLMVSLVGGGALQDKIRDLIKKRGLAKYIKMPGYRSMDELKDFYAKADIVINYYGFNPVIEALNYKAFVITREFGEMGKILDKAFNRKIYRVCLTDCKVVEIEDSLKEQYVDEVVKSAVWYFNNFLQISDSDFTPKRKITSKDFAQDVFS
ncbi:MAG: glycosyltransferase, partial [Candidatus Omnitrophica bacterium]|nr:glycosyltransferase [Candidatus Omnitrophota bacterium]